MPVIGLAKLLLTAAAILGAAAGVRALIARGRAARKPAPGSDAVEMTQCATCGIYVTGACERADCPRPRSAA
jgi:hypothetical protein